jgi:alkylation response protein AidB-like acyl-CoA dehydrogenase
MGTVQRGLGVRRVEPRLSGRLGDIAVEARAARLLCLDAGRLIGTGDPRAVEATWTAKYFAAGAAFRAAAAAVQIHGANGCGDGHPAARYLRDAKVMEIIEGTAQIQQTFIADSTLNQYRVGAADTREAADE